MDTRHGGRPSQVRPRSPSNGRPAPSKIRAVGPSPTRLARHRRIERRRSLPLVVKASLALAVVALSLGVLWVASGSVGPVIAAAVRGFGGLVTSLGAVVSSPDPTAAPPVPDAPTIVSPEEPYTNADNVDITVRVPTSVVGLPDYSVRLWVTLADTPASVLTEVAVGPTSTLVIAAVPLSRGRNDIQASIVGPGGESERSAIATWVQDTSKPKLTIISPKDKSSTTKSSITIKGKTQARSSVRLRNNTNGATTTADADADGLFGAKIAVTAGSNSIEITTTDPAGNTNSVTLTIRRGSGKLVVALTGTVYRLKASKLPRTLSFKVTVTGPDGKRVAGATALFTVSVPGLEAIVSSQLPTRSDGTATFTTTIPAGALAGSGLATVLVTTDTSGQGTDRQVLTVQ
jgi:Glucodextranase, domain B